jgi:hypothetical protein
MWSNGPVQSLRAFQARAQSKQATPSGGQTKITAWESV